MQSSFQAFKIMLRANKEMSYQCVLDLTRSALAAALAILSFSFSTFRKCCSSNNVILSGVVASLE